MEGSWNFILSLVGSYWRFLSKGYDDLKRLLWLLCGKLIVKTARKQRNKLEV